MMNRKKNILASTIAFFIGSGVLPGMVSGVLAEELDSGSAANVQVGMDEIIVTAQRRDQRLMDVPMAVSVVDPAEFTDVGLVQLADVIAYTPGITTTQSFAPGFNQITVRGVSASDLAGGATVGLYLDSVPLSSNSPWGNAGRINFDGLLGDIERIEVLKGPQGTLYGSTSLGGALKYVTRKPSLNELTGRISTDVSSTQDGGISSIYSARVSTPIVEDRVGFTVAGFFQDAGGFVDQVEPGTGTLLVEDADAYERYGVSADLYAEVSEQLSVRGRFINQQADYNANTDVDLDPITGDSIYPGFANDAGPTNSVVETTLYSGVIEYQFDGATLTSTSAYVESAFTLVGDIFNVGLGAFVDSRIPRGPGLADPTVTTSIPTLADKGSEKFVQEIQVASNGEGSLEWIAGLYYADEETIDVVTIMLQPGALFFQNGSKPSFYKEIAAFGNMTYNIRPNLDITIGARYSDNKMTLKEVSMTDATLLPAGTSVSNPIKESVDTYSVALSYRPSDDLSFYFRAASGYRPAFASNARAVGAGFPAIVTSDTLWSYEVGAKGRSGEGLLSYDVALWYLNWDDFQTHVSFSPLQTGAGNMDGGITGYGAEGSFSVNPTDALTIISSFAYTNSTLDDDEPTVNGLAGQQLPRVPEWTASSRIRYTFTAGAEVDASDSLGVRYEGSSRSDLADGEAFVPGVSPPGGVYDNRFNATAKSFTAVDANIGFTWDTISLSIYGTNIFNNEAFTSTQGAYLTSAQVTAVPLRPRTLGASLSVNF